MTDPDSTPSPEQNAATFAAATGSGRWRSNAQWPTGTVKYLNDVTEDTHGSKEEAEGVCRLLRENGFGGNRQVFPVRVWAEPVPND